ncbi:hypothetical protein EV421DRAFT_1805207 [Armillaria borealis]|uniref:Uncharacterized protein n=1 Tax=Armillaria borealis TaxID=47425 RepID=A0AA39JK12_9AGAR|nr:hypothetical protein EV421DRAFT_1805207 [Armillaria borealis]
MIIGLLPVLLHVSLALFFAGLAVFLFSLDMKVAWLVSIIGAATYTAYVIALILPLVYPYCPYKDPTTLYGHRLYQLVRDYLILRIALSLSSLVSPRLLFSPIYVPQTARRFYPFPPKMPHSDGNRTQLCSEMCRQGG